MKKSPPANYNFNVAKTRVTSFVLVSVSLFTTRHYYANKVEKEQNLEEK